MRTHHQFVGSFNQECREDEIILDSQRHFPSRIRLANRVATGVDGLGGIYCRLVCGGFLVCQGRENVVVALGPIFRRADRN